MYEGDDGEVKITRLRNDDCVHVPVRMRVCVCIHA